MHHNGRGYTLGLFFTNWRYSPCYVPVYFYFLGVVFNKLHNLTKIILKLFAESK